MEYDLIRLFEHPVFLSHFIPATAVTFGGSDLEIGLREK